MTLINVDPEWAELKLIRQKLEACQDAGEPVPQALLNELAAFRARDQVKAAKTAGWTGDNWLFCGGLCGPGKCNKATCTNHALAPGHVHRQPQIMAAANLQIGTSYGTMTLTADPKVPVNSLALKMGVDLASREGDYTVVTAFASFPGAADMKINAAGEPAMVSSAHAGPARQVRWITSAEAWVQECREFGLYAGSEDEVQMRKLRRIQPTAKPTQTLEWVRQDGFSQSAINEVKAMMLAKVEPMKGRKR